MAKKLVFANNPLLSGPALNQREIGAAPYRELPLSALDRDANQPRVNFDEGPLAELAESIRKYGVLSPILVRPARLPSRYQIIAGERRVRAAKIAGLVSIPAMVESEQDEGGARTLAIQLVENLQRSDLSPLERAHAIGALKESQGLSVREVAEQLGLSKSMVQRSLEILELPADLLNALREGASESKILMLAKVTDETERAALLQRLDELSRDDLLEKSELKGRIIKSKGQAKELSPEDRRIAEEIQRDLGLKVTMVRRDSDPTAGKLSIDFYSDEDLQVLFRKLVAGD